MVISLHCFTQIVNKFGKISNKLDGNIRLVLTTLIQTCCNKIVTQLTTQGCNNIVIS